ncbi:MAG: dihydroorotate dehydrogenase [Muribaculaceae bacterium]|nr:dihydroorotate dehydrogenase [Muribaculaceae bacterium]
MEIKDLSWAPHPTQPKHDLRVRLGGIELQNPVIPASGCFGFGYEMNEFYPVDILGSISIKGTTLNPRFGNPLPRVAECSSGLINSVGLQNPGIDAVVSKELPKLREVFHQPIIANISGFSVEEYVECCKRITEEPQIGLIELNVSCPNVHGGGMSFGTDPEVLAGLVERVKEVSTVPLFVKLTPNVTDIVAMAEAALKGGADGLCLINTLLGMRFDLKTGKPIIANVMGGFSGPAIFPVALRMVYQVRQAFADVPIIGCGGVSSASDVREMMLAGANAVEIGSANLTNPYACRDIIKDLQEEGLGLLQTI